MVQKAVVNSALGTGVVGEFYSNQPQRTRGQIINSATESLNVIGSVLTKVADSDDQSGVAASGVFAGILCSPKSLVRQGLDAQTTIANGTQVEVAMQGYLIVNLPAAADIGDFVYFSDTTGVLSTAAPGATAPVGTSRVPGGTVQIKNVTDAGQGIIYLDSAGDTTEPA